MVNCIECMRCTNTNMFIEKATRVHDSFYDYSQSIYVSCEKSVKILCPLHGIFEQTPSNHLRGKGCSTCGKERHRKKVSKSTADFIQDAIKIHGKTYDYSETNYVNIETGITIACPLHGKFRQLPQKHLIGQGCPGCRGGKISLSKRMTKEDFIESAKKIHGDRYDYSKVIYINAKQKVEIICPKHGPFFQQASNHLYGNMNGCPACGCNSVSSAETKWLNSLGIVSRQFDLPGTNITVDGYDAQTKTVYEYLGSFWHGNPRFYNPNDINPKTKTTYGYLFEKTQTRLKTIRSLGYNLVEHWDLGPPGV